MLVFVVLWYLAVPLSVKGGDTEKVAHEEGNGALLTKHSQRVDSYEDPSMKVTFNAQISVTSQLFRRCIAESNSVLVRYHFLKYVKSGVEFTRYIPNANQQTLYDPKWQDVNQSALNTSLSCATYAQKNRTVMMYQFDGSKCHVSTIRMPIRVPACGNRIVDPVFVRTSCPEPTVLVTLTPDAGAVNVTWTVNDPCNVNSGYQVKWVNVTGEFVAVLKKNVFNYRIKDLFGCKTQNVTVTAVDSASLPWGNHSAASADTLPRGPPVMATLTVDESVTSIHVSWSSDINECLRINNYVITLDNDTKTLGDNVFEYNLAGLHACQNITVAVKALYDEGSGISNILSEATTTLPEDPVIENFSATPSSYDYSITLNWTVRDHCELLKDLNISYGGATYDTLSNASRSYKAEGLACDTSSTFNLIPISGEGEEFGSRSSLNASVGPPAMVTLTVEESFTYIQVSWTSVDLCLRVTDYVVTWNNDQTVSLQNNVSQYTISRSGSFQSTDVTVQATYDQGFMTTNALSKDYECPVPAVVGELKNLTSHASYDGVSRYPPNIDSTVVLESPGVDTHVRIQFQAFKTQDRVDFLYIYDGEISSQKQLASLAGYLNASLLTYTSTGRQLILIFRTDEDTAYTGFRLLYDAV